MKSLVSLVAMILVSSGCESSPDIGRIAGTWQEVDSGRAFVMNGEGHGNGPYCAAYPCDSSATHSFPLVVKLNAFDEFLLEYDEGYAGSVGLIACGPCTLTNDDQHLTCKQHKGDGGFSTCEFDRQVDGVVGADATPEEK